MALPEVARALIFPSLAQVPNKLLPLSHRQICILVFLVAVGLVGTRVVHLQNEVELVCIKVYNVRMHALVCIRQTNPSVDRLCVLSGHRARALHVQKPSSACIFLRVLRKTSCLLVNAVFLTLDAHVGLKQLTLLAFSLFLDGFQLICVFFANGLQPRPDPNLLWLLILRKVLLIIEQVFRALFLSFLRYQ